MLATVAAADSTSTVRKKYSVLINSPGGGGGGGGSPRYLGGCIRSLSKFKNTPKALISGQKKLYYYKTLIFFH